MGSRSKGNICYLAIIDKRKRKKETKVYFWPLKFGLFSFLPYMFNSVFILALPSISLEI